MNASTGRHGKGKRKSDQSDRHEYTCICRPHPLYDLRLQQPLEADGPSGKQHRIDRRQIVYFGFGDDHQDYEAAVDPSKRPVLPGFGTSQEEVHAKQPQWRGCGVQELNLPTHELQSAHVDILVRACVSHELEARETVCGLPQHVRKEENRGHDHAEPEPCTQEVLPVRGQHEADDERNAQESDGVFVEQAKPDDSAEEEPEPGRLPGKNE